MDLQVLKRSADRTASEAGQRARGQLTGRVAIVTGASRGIGRVIAGTLAREGAAVAIVGRSVAHVEVAAAEIDANGGRALPVVADATDRQAVARLVDEVLRELGPPDILVNNAGGLAAVGPIWETDPERWWADVEQNLRSAAVCSWAVLPRMVAQGHGTIINVASISAVTRSGFDSAYSAAKAAVVRLTTSLAAETNGSGVRAFAVHPGTVRTELTRHLMDSAQGRRHFGFFHELRADEWSDPARVAALCVALATGRGDRLSGHFIDADDSPTKLFWRTVGRFGLAWRDLYALYLTRSTLDSAPKRGSRMSRSKDAYRGQG